MTNITVVGIIGYTGRMGQAIAHSIESHPDACLGGGIARKQTIHETREDNPLIVTDNPEELFPHCDVIVDFSHPSVTPMFARISCEHKKPFLSGTTGLDAAARTVLKELSAQIPVLHASNTSLSLAVTRRMIKLAATLLKDQDYDIAILDKHHRWKKDAPSGTALTLGQTIVEANGNAHEPNYASIRTGAIVGEHDIIFSGAGETITVQHTVTDRKVFARGAVHAAVWLRQQKPGFYSMDDVLGV